MKKELLIHKYMDIFYDGYFNGDKYYLGDVCWIDIIRKNTLRIGSNQYTKFSSMFPIDKHLFYIESLRWFSKKYPEKNLAYVQPISVSEYPHKNTI